MPLRTELRQLAVLAGTAGTYNAAVEAAANARAKLITPGNTWSFPVDQFDRDVKRFSIGQKDNVRGGYWRELNFSIAAAGSGTAGTVPSWGPLMEACGFSETIHNGVASIGALTAYSDPVDNAGGATDPTTGGTYAGTLSGVVELRIESLVTDTSITVSWWFRPDDDSAAEYQTTTHIDTTTEDPGAGQVSGVTLAFSDDPSVSTTPFRVGDRWFFNVVSSAVSKVIYATTSAAIPVLDLAYYTDGKIHKMHSCQFNVEYVGDMTAGAGLFNFSGMGVYEDVVDGALLTGIAYETTIAPAFLGVTMAINKLASQCFTQFSWATNNTIAPSRSPLATTGVREFEITRRAMTGRINPLATLVATEDVYDQLINGTEMGLRATLAGSAGNILQFRAPQVQRTAIADEQRGQFDVHGMDLRFSEHENDPKDLYEEFQIYVL